MGVNGKYAPRPGNIPGVVVNLGGNELVLAPLGIRLARDFEAKGKALSGGDGATPEAVHKFNVSVILASLHRNYPDIERKEVEALLDTANEGEAVLAVFSQSGLKKATPGELTPGSQ